MPYFLPFRNYLKKIFEENIDALSYLNTNANLTNITYTTNVKTVIDNNNLDCKTVNLTAGFDIFMYDKTGQSVVMPTSGRMSEFNIEV